MKATTALYQLDNPLLAEEKTRRLLQEQQMVFDGANDSAAP